MTKKHGTYVYVVSAPKDGYFAEMAAVSVASLRHCEPNAKISIVIDGNSAESPGIAVLKRMADDIVKVSPASSDPLFRSRFLKTGIRNMIDGDLLYLDCDTFVLRPLHKVWECDADVAAAPDINISGNSYTLTDNQKRDFDLLGWAMPRGQYLNSGVIYMKDNESVRNLSTTLREEWRKFYTALGKYNDQPAFNFAVRSNSSFSIGNKGAITVKVLPTGWNAQISMNQALGRNASVVHMFSGDFENSNDTVLHVAAKALKKTGYLQTELIQAAVDAGHVWIKLDRPRKLFAARQYLKACDAAFRQKVFKMQFAGATLG